MQVKTQHVYRLNILHLLLTTLVLNSTGEENKDNFIVTFAGIISWKR